jgi:hypothetical protein
MWRSFTGADFEEAMEKREAYNRELLLKYDQQRRYAMTHPNRWAVSRGMPHSIEPKDWYAYFLKHTPVSLYERRLIEERIANGTN